jgi:carbon-monoxide dehydrogenase medium subunit
MAVQATRSIYIAKSVSDAVTALTDHGPSAELFAGGTWVMRGPLRQETEPRFYVALSKVKELSVVTVSDDDVSIGACVTHAALAEALDGMPDMSALATAAAKSANPAIRRVATVGGNLSTMGFSAADLVPAMLCLDAEVEVTSQAGIERLPLAAYLQRRAAAAPSGVMTRAIIRRSGARSAHARLPLRKAGDYPVAILSVAVDRRPDGLIEVARVAVGSVETVARRWHALEDAMTGAALVPHRIAGQAAELLEDFDARDGIEAEGWYRLKVLPTLARRALETIAQQ